MVVVARGAAHPLDLREGTPLRLVQLRALGCDSAARLDERHSDLVRVRVRVRVRVWVRVRVRV